MRKDILNAINEIKEVKYLVNKSEIARRFGCSYNTVQKYIDNIPKESIKRAYTSKLDSFKGVIIDKVDNYGANGRGIYNFIKEKGYTGSYGTVSKFIKEYKNNDNKIKK